VTRRAERRTAVVLALGIAQTLAWASSYYLPAILADPIARELGISGTAVFAAFSAALLLSAALGPAVGRAIDRSGGRGVLCLSNLVFAADPALLAAHGPVLLTAAWLVTGAGMALGLYDRALRARRAQRHHRHHPDRRLRQHGRLAVDSVPRCCMGWATAC